MCCTLDFSDKINNFGISLIFSRKNIFCWIFCHFLRELASTATCQLERSNNPVEVSLRWPRSEIFYHFCLLSTPAYPLIEQAYPPVSVLVDGVIVYSIGNFRSKPLLCQVIQLPCEEKVSHSCSFEVLLILPGNEMTFWVYRGFVFQVEQEDFFKGPGNQLLSKMLEYRLLKVRKCTFRLVTSLIT